jgi:hypothetical protein
MYEIKTADIFAWKPENVLCGIQNPQKKQALMAVTLHFYSGAFVLVVSLLCLYRKSKQGTSRPPTSKFFYFPIMIIPRCVNSITDTAPFSSQSCLCTRITYSLKHWRRMKAIKYFRANSRFIVKLKTTFRRIALSPPLGSIWGVTKIHSYSYQWVSLMYYFYWLGQLLEGVGNLSDQLPSLMQISVNFGYPSHRPWW